MKAASALVVREVRAWRNVFVQGMLVLGAGIVLVRAFQLQILQREFLAHEGDKRSVRMVEVPPHRGAIRDRRGEALALSAPADSLWTIPSELLAAPEYLPALARLLDMKERELKDFLEERSGKQFVYLRRQISPEEATRIMALKAPGLFSQREYRRYYPAGEIAGHVVGFTDLDDRGQEGIEAAQEAVLAGKAGARRVIRDRTGRVIEEDEDLRAAQPGQDVLLTLDLRLQYFAYRELKAAVAQNHAKGGLVVVADSRTGDILAIANQPGFNPNRPEERASAGLRNRAVTDVFEPGSTIKPLLVARGLELGSVHAGDHIDTGKGVWTLSRSLTIHDTHPHGVVDLATLLAVSSNIGAAKIGLQMGPEAIYTGYRNFGIGMPVVAGFRGEANGVLAPYAHWGETGTATASYGYGVSVNALQLVRAYCAIANDGLMPQMSILDQTRGESVQRAISANVAREVRHLLEGVVSDEGTAKKAEVKGYKVAGKTGTIRKNEGRGYFENRHQSVFIGMVPAEHPRLVGLVMIDEPAAGQYYGGLVAAPVFANVMEGAARLLQLPPDQIAPVTQTAATPKGPQA
jgi:cell division protein FtsI (penicillin-binding protein 3)